MESDDINTAAILACFLVNECRIADIGLGVIMLFDRLHGLDDQIYE